MYVSSHFTLSLTRLDGDDVLSSVCAAANFNTSMPPPPLQHYVLLCTVAVHDLGASCIHSPSSNAF